MHINSIGTPLFYTIFIALILILIAIDIQVLNKKGDHQVSTAEALCWTTIWIIVSLSFAGWLYCQLADNPVFGANIAKDKIWSFLTAYVLEKSLSIDNIFVFVLIFNYLKIPPQHQQRILIYGVLGAIILRAIMIVSGSALVTRFEWILYFFGIFLLYSGLKLMLPEKKDQEHNPLKNPIIHWLTNHLRISQNLHGQRFFIHVKGQLQATPLLLALVIIELSDLIFAVDSIPAVFAVTTDPFIVFTSNILAVLGLRAMYFLLANIIEKFVYLKYGLATVLSFIGIKMLITKWVHINSATSLSIILSALLLSILASWWQTHHVKINNNHK